MKIIPMLDLKREYQYMKKDVDRAIKKCLAHQQWILGPEVRELEERVEQYLSVKHCIGVSSGTDALLLALRALAMKIKGREYFNREEFIITTPLTFTATGEAILRSGATPLFVDIDPETFNIDAQKIKESLRSNINIVGIVPVHLYGLACDMNQIMSIANGDKLFVVEDVAQALGGSLNGKKLGSWGDAAALSFFPSKTLGGFGDGGMVSTNDSHIAELIGMLRQHGGKNKNDSQFIGYNSRLDTIQSAILLAKMNYIDEFSIKRRKIAEKYKRCLDELDWVRIPNTEDHIYHQYTIRVCNQKRDELHQHLKENNVDSKIYYPVLLPEMKCFQNYSRQLNDFKIASKAVLEILSLPIEPLINLKKIDFICKKLTVWGDSHY